MLPIRRPGPTTGGDDVSYDLVIRNGTLVDGSGGEPTRADVAVAGDRIAAIGRVDGTAIRTIDADGCLVTPGFVDIHTHLDAPPAGPKTASTSRA
jgi:N-acyl-D-aspartate/D-glutamate deacylase